VVNVALGGTLRQDMTIPHRHVVHPVTLLPGSTLAEVSGTDKIDASCFHHSGVTLRIRRVQVSAGTLGNFRAPGEL
jgi:putative glutamine amidotransferase